MSKIEIVEEYRGHCGYTYIFPVRNINASAKRYSYEQNWDRIIGVFFCDINGFLLQSLNRNIDPQIQFFGNVKCDYPDYYEEFGQNFFSKEAVKAVIQDLHDELAINSAGHSATEIDFYRRLAEKLQATLSSAEQYEYILFLGP